MAAARAPKNDELHDAMLAVYEAERARSLRTFEILCDQQVIAQAQLRDANDPERRALKAGREAVEKREQLNEELQYSIYTMLRSGVPLSYIKDLADDPYVNLTNNKKKLFIDHVMDAAETYNRLKIASGSKSAHASLALNAMATATSSSCDGNTLREATATSTSFADSATERSQRLRTQ